MEICVNDYIRTDKGYICKIDKIDECKYCGQNVYIYKETIRDLHFEHTYHKGDITKHSKNIIDLIEVGDIIEIQTGLYSIYKINIEDEDTLISAKESLKGWTLKSILTKEQYEQNSYKI